MKILILGLPKTGTTALYSKIKNSLDESYKCFFEPDSYSGGENTNVISKVLFQKKSTDYNSFLNFDKKILIVRDLRDWVISGALYGFSYGPRYFSNESLVYPILNLLIKKEKNPNEVSLRELFRLLRFKPEGNFDIRGHSRMILLENFMKFHKDNNDFFVLKYEDFIDGNLEDLENYLGFNLTGSSEVGPNLRRVVRTKGYGNWKDWFTSNDIDYFKPILTPFMRKYGYDDGWDTNFNKIINPEHCSLYALRNINEKRNNAGLAPIRFNERGIINKIKKFLGRIQFQ